MKKHILQLGFGTQALRYIEESKKLNCYISAADIAKFFTWETSMDYIKMIDNPIEFNDFNSETFFDVIMDAQNKKNIDAIIPLADTQIVPATIMQLKLNIPGPGAIAAQFSTNKAIQRMFFKSENLPIPKFLLLTLENYELLLKKQEYPKIIKPINLFASIGVKLVRNYEEAIGHSKELFQSNNKVILLEEYIIGPEFSVESLVQNGEIKFSNITRKYTGEEPLFVEKGHCVPFPNLTSKMRREILSMNEKTIQVLNVQDSIVHLEARISSDRPIIMEVAVRTPGDRIMDLIEINTGLNIYKSVVKIALGEEVKIDKGLTNNGFTYVHWFSSDKTGKIIGFKGLQKVQSLPELIQFELIRKVDDVITETNSSFSRLGYCILSLQTVNDVEYFRDNLDEILDVEVRDIDE